MDSANLIGCGMLLGSLGIGVGIMFIMTGAIPNDNDMTVLLPAGALLLIVDLIYRFRQSNVTGRRRFYSGDAGGHFVLPVWIVGTIGFFAGLSTVLEARESSHAVPPAASYSARPYADASTTAPVSVPPPPAPRIPIEPPGTYTAW